MKSQKTIQVTFRPYFCSLDLRELFLVFSIPKESMKKNFKIEKILSVF